MFYPETVKGDMCDDSEISEVDIGLYECGNNCIRLFQGDDMIDLTPAMADRLIEALQRVRK